MHRHLLGICLLVAAGNLHAAALEKLEHIRATVRDFATQEVGGADDNVFIDVGRLDPRLRLPACDMPLTAYFSPGSRTVGHTTVGVRCDGAKQWSLFVPLHIDRQVSVAVALRNVPRGQVLTADDVHYELRSTDRLNGGYFRAGDALLGKVTRRPIQRGAAYVPNMVTQPHLVRRGDRITLALKSGTVAVRVAGTALSDGVRGERIPVRNLSSKRVIEGVVHDTGLVLVGNGGGL